MAYSMTYPSLLEDVRRYLERGFTEESDPIVYEQLPRLVTMAERRIARELKVQGFINAVTTALVPGQSVYAKPDRWRETISLSVDNVPIFPRSYEYVRNYWPDSGQTGTPEFYADYNYQNWLVVPTPEIAQTLQVLYYELPRLLDEENSTNWLTSYAPNLLLYGTLLEATPFLKKDERIAVWQSMYDRAAQSLNGEDMAKILDRATVRKDP